MNVLDDRLPRGAAACQRIRILHSRGFPRLCEWPLLLLSLVLAGCQSPVRLMPTPAVFATGEHNPFAMNPALETTNEVQVFYATNRLPLGPQGARLYTILAGPTLHLGTATLRIGPPGKAWEVLQTLSSQPSEDRRPVLNLDRFEELAMVKGSDAPDALRFFDAINAALEGSLAKDLTVYVHGANSNFETAVAQAAQYRHFTGRNSVVLAFAWPSAESGLRYFTDVQNARVSAPVFARLIDLLARHTVAQSINVLAYSAGAQVVSPGLAALSRHQGGSRLGEVYLAAPDVALRSFAAQFPHYIGRARRVTVSVNLNDAVLGISEWFQGTSRLGKPDPTELSAEQSRWLIDASTRLDFDLISVRPEVIQGQSPRSHSFWYDHPWVSSDVMIKLLFHIPPAERGLTANRSKRGFDYWTFPPDYDRRVVAVMRSLRAARLRPPSGAGDWND